MAQRRPGEQSASLGQQVLRRLDKAYREFMQGKRGRPRFKNWRRFDSVNYKPGDGAGLKKEKLRIQLIIVLTAASRRIET